MRDWEVEGYSTKDGWNLAGNKAIKGARLTTIINKVIGVSTAKGVKEIDSPTDLGGNLLPKV